MRNVSIMPVLFVFGCAVGADNVGETSRENSGKGDQSQPVTSIELAPVYQFQLHSALTVLSEDTNEPETFVLGMAGLVTNAYESDEHTLYLQPCSVILPAVDDYEASIASDAVQRVPPVRFLLELNEGMSGVELRTSRGALMAGVAMNDPFRDELPDDDNDERLVDIDEDGNPGLTLLVDNYEIYTALRIGMVLEGVMNADQVIEGSGEMSIDIGIYGDNVLFDAAASAARKALGKLTVTDQMHEFSLVPATGIIDGCDAFQSAQ